MITTPDYKTGLHRSMASAGLITGLLVGAAIVIQTLVYGGNPVKAFQFIASGVLGKGSFSGGLQTALLGLMFHFIISYIWTLFFFLIYPKLNFLSRNVVLAGSGTGLFIWVIMTQVVIPLSNVRRPPFDLQDALIEVLILIITIGLPLSHLANKHYSQKN